MQNITLIEKGFSQVFFITKIQDRQISFSNALYILPIILHMQYIYMTFHFMHNHLLFYHSQTQNITLLVILRYKILFYLSFSDAI